MHRTCLAHTAAHISIRELALRIQELERSMSEYQGMRARLQNTRDELNDYKIKV